MPAIKKKNSFKTSAKKTGKKKRKKSRLLKILEVFSLIFLLLVVIYTLTSGKNKNSRNTLPQNTKKEITLSDNIKKTAIPASKLYSLHSVKDGDTIIVKDSGNNTYEICLYGIDSPELDQQYGKEAKNYLQKITTGKKLKVIPKTFDSKNRNVVILQEIIYGQPDELSINQRMIQAGYAWVHDELCMDEQCNTWKLEQGLAMSQKIGLWNQSLPMAPWKYRQQSKK